MDSTRWVGQIPFVTLRQQAQSTDVWKSEIEALYGRVFLTIPSANEFEGELPLGRVYPG